MTASAPSIDVTITGLTADSRAVRPGYLFAALPGTKADGRAFIPAAIANGAVAVLVPHGSTVEVPPQVALVQDANPRRRFALMASAFHGAQPRVMAAVTGTNGKTSTAEFFRQIMTRLGHRSAAIGTLGIIAPGWDNSGGLTTPDPAGLHADLARLAEMGITHACMEASSHGLDQHRLDGVKLMAAAFTNLTRDHLDYHASMQAYAEAKLRLFAEVLPEGATAVINADSDLAPRAVELCAKRGITVLGYGRAARDLRLAAARPTADGQELDLEIMGRAVTIRLPLAGRFQADNALAALGLALACGADPVTALEALGSLEGVHGRLQKVAARAHGAPVYVDYAHTPDALETVLKALRPHASRRLVVVFGCGGDRDAGKRPLMGAIGCRLADAMIVTDDNPRSEDPAAIRAAVRGACPAGIEIGDRRDAIRAAVSGLQKGDVLVIAGKGHEKGQIVGTTVLAFDDAEEARTAVDLADGGVP
ncbi:UDP-N-acetylmuramoylalanyl-D-glutamate--2 6-diaminopimelate ligase [Paramagnetospirillum magnetotacticum MS-1]|uniref:UDP-N-acetylmuramoyl-L-alanyl-D-glutamate--2,6-diaminopimelate ligase n=1 Tax=Paramagnetospirillum magnetotacticum MS-1 TaxID=272627 RepID=A0A0C2YQ52_PARME|nr:UDP-N-acetylmuramoyl-L-alanyl-D-glutamate--2,6-diaminopimelate ligase [Paramagnetospirillum magnetotacticum]KIL96795.1 UDP-N-acetylmuramoylalanyl-D-glutamate--2 6-diaminopimelate ligase [Paramagnetospirillum magnetotacticum MS-1]